jgi:hypothetical protein
MSKIVEYQLVTNDYFNTSRDMLGAFQVENLNQKVQRLIEDGWAPLGGPVTQEMHIYQAMTRTNSPAGILGKPRSRPESEK